MTDMQIVIFLLFMILLMMGLTSCMLNPSRSKRRILPQTRPAPQPPQPRLSGSTTGRKKTLERQSLSRPGHHVRHRIPPGRIVRGLFVRFRILLAGIGLIEDEMGGIGAVLQYVEAMIPRFPGRSLVVQPAGLYEGRDGLGFDVDVDQSDMHGVQLPSLTVSFDAAAGTVAWWPIHADSSIVRITLAAKA